MRQEMKQRTRKVKQMKQNESGNEANERYASGNETEDKKNGAELWRSGKAD